VVAPFIRILDKKKCTDVLFQKVFLILKGADIPAQCAGSLAGTVQKKVDNDQMCMKK
jgi:hypothetical protein